MTKRQIRQLVSLAQKRARVARSRDWNKYIKSNWPGCGDCQMVSAANAYYFLTGKTIDQNSSTYQKQIDLCGARHGAVINLSHFHKALGLKYTREGAYFIRLGYDRLDKGGYTLQATRLSFPLPLEARIWHKSYGFHSVLIVDWEPVTESVRVTNFAKETNDQGWIYMEDFQHYIKGWNRNKTSQERLLGFELKGIS